MIRTESSVMLSRDEYKALAGAVMRKVGETDYEALNDVEKVVLRITRVEVLLTMERFLFEGGKEE